MNIDKMQELLREFVGNVSKLKLYDEKNFAFVSYAHTTEAEHVYTTLIELALDGYLFAADISYKDSTESWVMEMTEKVASSGCKCMINFIDIDWMYSRNCLGEQAYRYSSLVKDYHDDKNLPSIQLTRNWSRQDLSKRNEEKIEKLKAKVDANAYKDMNRNLKEALEAGLTDIYSTENEKEIAIKRLKVDFDAVRVTMKKILNKDKNIDNTNSWDDLKSIKNMLEQKGVTPDEEVKKIAESIFCSKSVVENQKPDQPEPTHATVTQPVQPVVPEPTPVPAPSSSTMKLSQFVSAFDDKTLKKDSFQRLKITSMGANKDLETDYCNSTFDLTWQFVMNCLRRNAGFIEMCSVKYVGNKFPPFIERAQYVQRPVDDQKKYKQVDVAGLENYYMFRHLSQYGWINALRARIVDFELDLNDFNVEYVYPNQEAAAIIQAQLAKNTNVSSSSYCSGGGRAVGQQVTAPVTGGTDYLYAPKDAYAIITVVNGQYIVRKGSRWASSVAKDGGAKRREKLVSAGVIRNNTFVTDYAFTSPSGVAVVISGTSVKGNSVFVEKNQISRETAEGLLNNLQSDLSDDTSSGVSNRMNVSNMTTSNFSKTGVGELL